MNEAIKGSDTDNNTSTPNSKRLQPPDSAPNSPNKDEVSDILIAINNNLTGLDARIALIEILHKELQQLRVSLEFSQEQISTLVKENKSLQHSLNSLTKQFTTVVNMT